MRNNFLPILMMSSYASMYGGCGGDEAKHVCHDCPDGRVREFARVRSGGWIKKGYLATLMVNPTLKAKWDTGVVNGNIILVPESSGSFDPGDPKELKGYGDLKSTYGAQTMKLLLNDPDYISNYAFYNEIKSRRDLVPFYRTSSLVHIFDTPASIKAKDPVADDLEEEIVWNVEMSVTSDNLPSKHPIATIADVFTCTVF